MLKISVCMIVKNEEDRLERCLSSLSPYGFELVIVDTGSTDKTLTIAAKYGACIYHFPWCNDFSAARNFSLEKASYDWILMMDSDEWVESIDIEELDYFRKNLSSSAGSIIRKNYVGEPGAPSMTQDQTERFFSRKHYFYTGRIHEQLTPRPGTDFHCLLLNTSIFHDGYLMTKEQRLLKGKRNLTIMREQLDTDPQNPYYLFQMGKAYDLLEEKENALAWYGKGLDYATDTELAYVSAMVLRYGELLLETKRLEDALLLQYLYDDFKSSADFIYLLGQIYMACSQYDNAAPIFLEAVRLSPGNKAGTNSYLAWFQLAEIAVRKGDLASARDYLQRCSNYPPALDILDSIQNLSI